MEHVQEGVVVPQGPQRQAIATRPGEDGNIRSLRHLEYRRLLVLSELCTRHPQCSASHICPQDIAVHSVADTDLIHSQDHASGASCSVRGRVLQKAEDLTMNEVCGPEFLGS
jgi:hypothetical protein